MTSKHPEILIIQLPVKEANFLKESLTYMIDTTDPSSEGVLLAKQILSKVTDDLNWIFSYNKDES